MNVYEMNVVDHQRNSNQNLNEMVSHICFNDHQKKKKKHAEMCSLSVENIFAFGNRYIKFLCLL